MDSGQRFIIAWPGTPDNKGGIPITLPETYSNRHGTFGLELVSYKLFPAAGFETLNEVTFAADPHSLSLDSPARRNQNALHGTTGLPFALTEKDHSFTLIFHNATPPQAGQAFAEELNHPITVSSRCFLDKEIRMHAYVHQNGVEQQLNPFTHGYLEFQAFFH